MRPGRVGKRGLACLVGALLLGPLFACGAATSPAPAGPPPRATAASAAAPAALAAASPAGQPANPYLAAPGAPLQTLRVATCAVSGGFVHLYTALESGLFTRYGFNVEHTAIRGSSPALAALSAGEIHFLYCAADATIPGLASGADAKLVGAAMVGIPYVLLARPDVRAVADLRGKAIGISRAGDLTDKLARAVLQRHGLVANEDVALRPIGGSQPERYQALLADVVQGIPITPPLDAQARRDGIPVIYDLAELGLPFVYSAVHATNARIRDEPALVERFVAAMGDAVTFTAANPALARDALRKTLEVDDPDVLDAAYEAYARKIANPRLHIPLDAVAASVDDARAAGTAVVVSGPADIATNQFVDALAARGFFEAIQAGVGPASR